MVAVNADDVKGSSANGADSTDDVGKKYHHKNIKDEKQTKERKSHIPSTNSGDDKEDLVKLFIDVCKKIGQQIKRSLSFILMDLGGKQLVDRCAQWCVQHPHLAICILAVALVVSLPILMFVAFALSTLVLTFTGFLVLEGTLLTVITMIMIGLLGAFGIFLFFCAFVGLATYYGISQAYDMYDSETTERNNLRNFIKKFNQKLISAPNAGGGSADVGIERLN